jgi:hypothetical protein
VAYDDKEMLDIFSFEIRNMPTFLVEWGQSAQQQGWDTLRRAAEYVWVIGIAVTLAEIFVARLHPSETKEQPLANALLWAVREV